MRNGLPSGIAGTATSMTGIAHMIEMIPDNIGRLACLIGIFVSLCVIIAQIYNIKKTRLETKKLEIEIEKNRRK